MIGISKYFPRCAVKYQASVWDMRMLSNDLMTLHCLQSVICLTMNVPIFPKEYAVDLLATGFQYIGVGPNTNCWGHIQ